MLTNSFNIFDISNSVSDHLSWSLSRSPLKWDIEDNYLSTCFGVRNFENTSFMRAIFFWKCSVFNENFRNVQNIWENVCCFWHKCISVGCVKFSLLKRECLSSAVNLLTNSLKIFHIPKRDFFQYNYLHSDQKQLKKCCRLQWKSISAYLRCCDLGFPLKQDFLEIYLTTCFGVRNFGNT